VHFTHRVYIYILLLNRARAIISPRRSFAMRKWNTRSIVDRGVHITDRWGDYQFNCRAALRQKEKIISNVCAVQQFSEIA
jgi:hypothetical protein